MKLSLAKPSIMPTSCPRLMVAGQTGARVVKLPLGADRLPDIASLSALITPRSRVLAIGQMSNVTGGCPDWRRLSALLTPPGWW